GVRESPVALSGVDVADQKVAGAAPRETPARRITRLRAAKRLLGRRLWTVYTGGAPSTLGQLLGADGVHDTPRTPKYQEQGVGADRAAPPQAPGPPAAPGRGPGAPSSGAAAAPGPAAPAGRRAGGQG